MTFILGTLLCVHLVLQHKLKKYFEPFSNESSSLSITLCLIICLSCHLVAPKGKLCTQELKRLFGWDLKLLRSKHWPEVYFKIWRLCTYPQQKAVWDWWLTGQLMQPVLVKTFLYSIMFGCNFIYYYLIKKKCFYC